MRGFGILLIIFGIGSFILRSMDMEFRLLMWIDSWGQSTGNVIRVIMAVVGLLLVIMSFRKRND